MPRMQCVSSEMPLSTATANVNSVVGAAAVCSASPAKKQAVAKTVATCVPPTTNTNAQGVAAALFGSASTMPLRELRAQARALGVPSHVGALAARTKADIVRDIHRAHSANALNLAVRIVANAEADARASFFAEYCNELRNMQPRFTVQRDSTATAQVIARDEECAFLHLAKGSKHQDLVRTNITTANTADGFVAIATRNEAAHCDPFEQLTPAQVASITLGPVLGSGAFGVVHQAVLPGGQVVAIKLVRTQNQLNAVRRETNVAKQAMRHPNIITVHGCGIVNGKVGIAMELASNGSLLQLAKDGRLSVGIIRHYARQVLHGLQHLHERGIVHGDIKGENILIDVHGVAKIADFGCAMALPIAADQGPVGSVFWMAPEVLWSRAYGTEADVWSFGCTVVEMLNGGNLPWMETFDNPFAAIKVLGHSNVRPTGIRYNDLAPACEAFLNRCFERDGSSRASVAELLEDPWMSAAEPWPTEPR